MYISKGNQKVKCAIFNLPAGTTCKKGLECQKYCYAKKAERQYKQVLPCRKLNLKASKGESFVSSVNNWIESQKKTPEYFRIHESGDFYSREYILKWYDIAFQNKNTTFFCYTKRDDLFTKTLLKIKPKNLIINYSIDSICDDLYKAESNYIDAQKQGFNGIAIVSNTDSNCHAQKSKDIKCMKQCFKCALENQIIIFKKH